MCDYLNHNCVVIYKSNHNSCKWKIKDLDKLAIRIADSLSNDNNFVFETLSSMFCQKKI